jgi:hypothetical protein
MNVKAMNESMGHGKARTVKEIEGAWEVLRKESEERVLAMCQRYELATEQAAYFRKSSTINQIAVRERWLRKCFIKGLWEDVHELRGELLRQKARSAQQSQLAEDMVQFAGTTQRKLSEDFARLTQASVLRQQRMYVQRGVVAAAFVFVIIKGFSGTGSFLFSNSLTFRYKNAMLS